MQQLNASALMFCGETKSSQMLNHECNSSDLHFCINVRIPLIWQVLSPLTTQKTGFLILLFHP